ncbi:hypothetical protein TWF679_002848 [Orbilia oligospora]|uniref:Uncharacterized protein n=1 Tax=Orbilia oligospora TaxID=2813651 RepID=A0A8H8USK9_ORBOL|nr:hypothetical protein TWF679_002848 [Orbilia oligospora]
MADETSSAAQSIRSTCSPSLNTIISSSTARPTSSSRNGINEHSRKLSEGGKLPNQNLNPNIRPSPPVNMISNHSRSLSHPVNKTSTALVSSAFLDPSSTSFPHPHPPLKPLTLSTQSAIATAPTSSNTVSNTASSSTFGPPPHLPPPIAAPFTPTRPSLPRGLSLQLPSQTQPLPPYLDPALGFSTVRRPRLDFTRSCTSLHHSFVADSPDSSPLTPSMPIPRRGLDSPIAMYTGGGGGGGGGGAGGMLSSMLADSRVQSDSSSDSSSSSDDEMELSSAHSQFGPSLPSSSGGMNDIFNSSALLNRRHMTRLRGTGRSRQSSSSASASSTSLASPSPTTPPNGEIKKSASGGYFGSQLSDMLAQRRQSISQAMKKIGFLSGSGASEETKVEGAAGKQTDAVRRPVVRRGNLLPKPKHFQRVKAALIEESAPVDAEMRIEAAIQRQLREDDDEEDTRTVPQTPVLNAQVEDDNALVFEDTEDEAGGPSFKSAAQRNSGYWGTLESSSPSGFMGFRMNPDGDIIMGTDSMVNSPISRSPEVRKLKRRRDDDEIQFEPPSIIKRRAVSPGFSQSPTVLSSPVAIPANTNQNGTNGGAASGTRSKRSSYILDAHEGLGKMSIGPFG